MNPKTQEIINNNLREYFMLGTKVNNLKIERSANLEHEIAKSIIYCCLRYEGREIVVNGKLKNGQIPDLFVVDLINPIIYEIGHSEEEIRETKEYPCLVKFIKTKDKRIHKKNYPFKKIEVKCTTQS